MGAKLQPSLLLQAVLRPLIRYCLKRGVRIHELTGLIRSTLVQEAKTLIEEASGESSVSKISVVSGLNRIEVAKLLKGSPPAKSAHDILNRIVGLWSDSARFRDPKTGKPQRLTYQGLQSEFARLVSRISKEMNHYPILFELERIGAITYKDELVELNVEGYYPTGDVEHRLDLLSNDVAALIETVEDNLSSRQSSPDLHLCTSYDNIDPELLEEIRNWIIARGASFQKEIREYLSQRDRDVNPQMPHSSERAKVTVSVFSLGRAVVPAKQLTPKKRGRKKKNSE
jgi:hypothetical protein